MTVKKIGSIHLLYINPLPKVLGEFFSKYESLVVPELNNGQLVRILRDRYLLPFVSLTKIQGQPFKSSEIVAKIESING
jgi:2-oxoglutarate ferredoxin oxidoreductase subunit alpha